MRTALLLALACGVICAATGVYLSKRDTRPEAVSPAAAMDAGLQGTYVNGQSPTRKVPSYGRFSAYMGQGLIQTYDFGAHWDPQDPTHLVIYNRAPGVFYDVFSLDHDEFFEFSASFDILAIQAKTRDHFYLGGRSGNQDVIERWKKAQVSQGNGSGYVMKRVELYRGALGGIKAVGVDHLGRYLLVLHGQSPVTLSRMPLPGGGQPIPLYTSTQIPEMAASEYSIFARMHTAGGVLWTLEDLDGLGPGHYILLGDAQDDGVIDEWEVLTNDEYFSQYGSSSVWSDWFMSD